MAGKWSGHRSCCHLQARVGDGIYPKCDGKQSEAMKTSSQPDTGSDWCLEATNLVQHFILEVEIYEFMLFPTCMAGKSQSQTHQPAFKCQGQYFLTSPAAGRHCAIRLYWSQREPTKTLLGFKTLGKFINFPQAPSLVPSAWRTSFIWVLCVYLPILLASCCIWNTVSHLSLWEV